MADDRQKCLDAGCNDYLSKPIDRRGLLLAVAKWADAAARRTEFHSVVSGTE
jgi:CheY-like chemotaxis protein